MRHYTTEQCTGTLSGGGAARAEPSPSPEGKYLALHCSVVFMRRNEPELPPGDQIRITARVLAGCEDGCGAEDERLRGVFIELYILNVCTCACSNGHCLVLSANVLCF